MEKMTIHRGLAELKLLDARIGKATSQIEPVGFQKKDGKVNNHFAKDEFENDAKSKYDSAIDLIDRKVKIKSAIVKANATTMVKVGEQTMSIADAINLKQVIAAKQLLAATLAKKLAHVRSTVESHNSSIDRNALDLAKTALGKDNVKASDTDAQSIIEPFKKANEVTLVDPLEVQKKIETLENEVTTFQMEIDAVLSEVNATTIIEF